MTRRPAVSTLIKGLLVAQLAVFGLAGARFPDPPAAPVAPAKGTQTAVLAGGCFWGLEMVFESLKGVSRVTSGYAGGNKETAHYDIVSNGTTGHAESVEISYDPSQISYGQLLKVYFSVAHDPTELDRQGPDSGTQYRSAIFYANDMQKKVAEAYITKLGNLKTFAAPIVTKVVPLRGFYAAEDYHQHFGDKNPNYPYIVYNDKPKVEHLKKEFPEMLKRS